MQLHALFQQSKHLPPLSLNALISFIRIAQVLRPSIEIELLKASLPPEKLSHRICSILAGVLRHDPATINQYWAILKDHIWSLHEVPQLSEEEILCFNNHALALNICKPSRPFSFSLVSNS